MRKYKGTRIVSVLAVLILSTACSTTENITITAPGDTTAPTDGTTAPGDTTAPTDSTAAPGGDAPTGYIPAPTNSTPSAEMSETPVAVSDQNSADGQESAEPAPFTYEYPESWLINPNDRSTSLGKLCWALFEYTSSVFARINQVLADNTPNWEVTFPAVADITEGADNGVGPVGVVNEESNEQSTGSEGYLIGSLNKILEPSLAGIVDDPELSEELQLFAEAFFAYIEAEEEQIRAVGWANVDSTQLPYQHFEDMPHIEELSEAIMANPDKCVSSSSMDDAKQFYDDLYVEIEEYLEETGGPVTIE